MRSRIGQKSFLILFTLLCLVAVTVAWESRFRGQGSTKEAQESAREKRRNQYPIANSDEPESSDINERIKRQRQNKKYNGKSVVVGPQLVQSSEGYEWPVDFQATPVFASDAIIVGTISDTNAHLSEDKNSVYSEFTVRVDSIKEQY
jgi:hypothetical protein